MTLAPFFPFYGSKWRSARLYPAPRHELVVEPFAGSAGYATYYEPRRVKLLDGDPIIVGVWEFLIGASAADIRRLPDVEVGQDVREMGLCQEASWLIGFWLNRGSAQPKRKRTAYSARTGERQLVWGERARERLACQVDRIRHWEVRYADYTLAASYGAVTWFVDPPYEDRGRYYRVNTVNLGELAGWCRDRVGQVIVCENAGASWLPFEPLAPAAGSAIKSSRGTSAEVVWTSDRTRLF